MATADTVMAHTPFVHRGPIEACRWQGSQGVGMAASPHSSKG